MRHVPGTGVRRTPFGSWTTTMARTVHVVDGTKDVTTVTAARKRATASVESDHAAIVNVGGCVVRSRPYASYAPQTVPLPTTVGRHVHVQWSKAWTRDVGGVADVHETLATPGSVPWGRVTASTVAHNDVDVTTRGMA